MSKITCPFCLHRISPEPITSSSGGMLCPRDECESHKRQIPLPKEAFDYDVFPIAIVGASSSGKTYFLTALMNEFISKPMWDGDYWRIEMVHYAKDMEHESADNRFVKHWRDLFRNKTPLSNTQTGEYLSPLILSVTYSKERKWTFHEPFRKRKQLLVFHDVPGEFTTSDDARMALSSRYGALGAAKGVIVLVEPRELPLLGSQLVANRKIPQNFASGGGFAFDAINGLRVAKQHGKPVAVCLSKSDLFLDVPSVIERDAHLVQYKLTNVSTAGALNLADISEVAADVRNIFERLGGGDLLSRIDSSFRYSSLFAVSSLGEDVVDAFTNTFKRDAIIRPIRVMDPILWMLWQHGMLGGVS